MQVDLYNGCKTVVVSCRCLKFVAALFYNINFLRVFLRSVAGVCF